MAAARNARAKDWLERSTGKLDGHSMRPSRSIRATCAHASRARGLDYIVDTKMTRGTRWVLGGGSRKRAFIGAREAAGWDAEFFAHVEAEFALWEMLVRDRQLREAATIAQRLARDFPENHKLATFLKNAHVNP